MDRQMIRTGGLGLAAAMVAGLGALAWWGLRPAPLADGIALPSGRAVEFLESRMDTAGPAGLTARFFFRDPALRAGADVTADMQALCDQYALPRLATGGPEPAQIVISLADRAVAFGQSDPDAVQYFEAFSPKTGACIWEVF